MTIDLLIIKWCQPIARIGYVCLNWTPSDDRVTNMNKQFITLAKIQRFRYIYMVYNKVVAFSMYRADHSRTMHSSHPWKRFGYQAGYVLTQAQRSSVQTSELDPQRGTDPTSWTQPPADRVHSKESWKKNWKKKLNGRTAFGQDDGEPFPHSWGSSGICARGSPWKDKGSRRPSWRASCKPQLMLDLASTCSKQQQPWVCFFK